jgi:hypothetical protein
MQCGAVVRKRDAAHVLKIAIMLIDFVQWGF